ncbi:MULTISPECIES: hypothetical protein [unclassified Methylobacterium]|uniref:hypothetical protein n=1 Tax=unclassified Methylobacterium TaxID=2615210 RepID=UPI0011C207E1|nr:MULTISPECIES: hypothetical protein [unclassified Methylobacterium]MCJ2144415.1 hypothetical protein [Methylobacterium sp. E-066]QEE38767.1 hypothetical protein FVA80_07110 [Methylobacterium sp. WL1]TXN57391.1 hypothetical protein FV241_11300 [Methylobacterium sp. WL2]
MRLLKHRRARQNVSVLGFANFLRGSANHVGEGICDEIVEAAGVVRSLDEDAIVTASHVTLPLRLQQVRGDR